MRLSLVQLLCSIPFVALTHASVPGACSGGQPAQLASAFVGYKPASSYCASNYAVATVTNNRVLPIQTITSVVSTATVVNGTTTVTVTGSSPSILPRSVMVAAKNIEERDISQDQIFNNLQPDMLSSICACLRVISTFTKSIIPTSTKTVSKTATTFVVQTQTSYIPNETPAIQNQTSNIQNQTSTDTTPVSCLTNDTAAALIRGFASLLTGYTNDLAEALLASDFTDTSDSINQLAGYQPGSVTFPNKIAFEYGQGSQPPIGFTVLSIDTVTCTSATFRWAADVGIRLFPVKGINSLVASNLNNTSKGWQIKSMYSEFNSLGWFLNLGGDCSFPSFN